MTSDRVPYTQAGRMMAIATSLGEDQLLLTDLDVSEAMNGLFEIRASVKAQRDDLQAGDLIGSTIDFSLQLKDGGTRYWNGFATELHEGPLTTRGTRNYAMTARPRLWVLSQRADCRIFQDQTSPQIIETLCKEHGIVDIDLRITGKPAPQHYSVQWNETDLAYMIRRMEEDGLFFWHDHAQGKHTLVVADHPTGYRDSAEPQVRYAQGSADRDHITDWRRTFAYTPGKRAGRDWSFEAMQAPSGEQTSFVSLPGNARHELYEYPGRFLDTSAGEQMIKNRIQATETGFETVEAASTVRTLGPGQKFTPYDTAKPDSKFDQQVVAAIRHTAVDPSYEAAGGQPEYDNAFSVMPSKTPATPHRSQPRPKIIGSQIALIAGPQGEEIHTDQYGRVKVWFPWDRRAVKDGSDTCWIRVGQPWAGGTWGHQVIPRVGMESLISYQDGDPDRPFVTALVPDPINKVPYPLPDNKTRMVFRSNSYKSSGYNEMTFEDKTSGERIHTFGQKDQTTRIGNNATQHVNQNAINNVGANQSVQVGANMQQNVGGGMSIAIGAVGGAVPSLITSTLSGLMGQSSSMLGEAMGVVSNALQQAASAGLSQAAGGGAAGAAGMAAGGINPPAPSFGGAGSSPLAALQSSVSSYAAALGGGIGPAVTAASSAAQALTGVGSTSGMNTDAGLALSQAGASTAQQVAGMIGSGILNQVVGQMQNNSVGIAKTEQVGNVKALAVGNVYTQKIGHQLKIDVGDEVIITVGPNGSAKSTLIMKGDGTILLKGIKVYIEGDSHIQMLTPMLDHN